MIRSGSMLVSGGIGATVVPSRRPGSRAMSMRKIAADEAASFKHGYSGLFGQRWSKHSYHRAPVETVELEIYSASGSGRKS